MEVFLEELYPPYTTSSTRLPSLLTVGMARFISHIKDLSLLSCNLTSDSVGPSEAE